MKELFEKIYIKTESDLPKEDGFYFCWLKGDKDDGTIHYREFTFYNTDDWHNEDMWLKDIDWYLRPVEQKPDCYPKEFVEWFINNPIMLRSVQIKANKIDNVFTHWQNNIKDK
jgi:hypothetical protein